MAGKVRRKLLLKNGEIVETTVPQGTEILDALGGPPKPNALGFRISLDKKLPVELTKPRAIDNHGFAAPERDLPGTIKATPRNNLRLPPARALKAGVGDLVEGTASALALPSNALYALTGNEAFNANWGEQARNAVGLGERGNPIAEQLNIGGIQALLPAAGAKAALPFLGKTGQAAANFIGADEPLFEGIAGAGGLGAAEAAKEQGLPEWAQVGAGLVGGIGTYGAARGLTSPVTRNTLRAVAADNRGSILGERSTSANLKMLEKARKMETEGATPDEIFEATYVPGSGNTGWYKQHGQWKYEISDEDLRVKKGQIPPPGRGTHYANVLEHPGLEHAYPDLANAQGQALRIGGLTPGPGKRGGYSTLGHAALINRTMSKPDVVSTAAHELAHAVPQQAEGFPRGSSMGENPPVYEGDRVKQLTDSRDFIIDTLKDGPMDANTLKVLDDLDTKIEEAAAYEGYRRSAGETEARNVQTRLNWTVPERQAFPPWVTQDYPDEQQFLNWSGGKAPEGLALNADDTTNFDKWFEGSKAVDENGQPLTLYHGSTARGLTEFDTSRVTNRSALGDVPGTYFTTDPMAASGYTRPPISQRVPGEPVPRGQVYDANLSLKNPLDTTDTIARLQGEGMSFMDAKREALKELDPAIHDGIVFRGNDVNSPEYVAFEPTQIKSASRNSGAYDPNDPNIYQSFELPEDLPPPMKPSKNALATARELSTMAGSPAGARAKVTTRQAKKLSEDYLRQVEQGASGADWYEQSGRSIMEHMGENEPAAIKLAGAIGVTSSRTPVLPNLEHGIRGHYQAIGGQPAFTGGFPTAMGKDIDKIYSGPDLTLDQLREAGDEAFGPKRTPFIQQNLMYEGFEPGQQSTARAVHDIWDMRARGYTDANGQPFSGTPSTAQHRWADLQDQGYLIPEAQRRAIANREDWDTGRLQASAWVGNKIDALMAKGKTFEEARDIAVTDYSHGWDRLYANHSWESAPGSNTGHLGGFDDLPWEEKQRYHEDVKGAFLNPEGQSRIALGYGAPTGKSYDTAGLYEGVVSPGTQDLIAVPRASKSQVIDPAAASRLDTIAATHGLLGGQKGAAWNYQSPAKSTLAKASALRFDMGRTLTLDDIERMGPKIQEMFPAGNVGLLPDPKGFKLAKFWDEEGDDLPGLVKQLRAGDTALPKPFPTTQSGNYLENAWDAPAGRFGGQYLDVIKGSGGPDVAARFDRFAPEIAQKLVTDIDPRMMRDAGLTGSADMDRLRRTIAGEGWAGLVKLVESQKGSVEAKGALLMALAGLAGGGALLTSETRP